jgi:GMP synthase (glutamine-hydrolysing)
MRKIMVFQHVAHEPLGTLDPMLKAAGFRIRYINFGRHPDMKPSLEGYNGLIVLGGPMGVYEADAHPHLITEMELIREAVQRNIPVLGICLGAQLIAGALGSQVKKTGRWEFGWHGIDISPQGRTNPLFKDFKNSEKVFQIHQDTFDLPKDAIHLASSPICKNQAFCFGEKVYGYQFHLESDQATILRWLHRPEQKKLIEELGGEVTHDSLVADTEKYIQRSLELSQLSFGKFIEIFQLPERPIVLRSTR